MFFNIAVNGENKEAWGYVNVRPNAYMFWWLYFYDDPSENYANHPLVIWLQVSDNFQKQNFFLKCTLFLD